MNLGGISATDGRRLEVVANGLPLYQGRQVAIDATIVSPVHADGSPLRPADVEDGVALRGAIRRKHVTYHELLTSRRCHLLVAAIEVGGRWAEEPYQFIVQMARAKARAAPAVLRTALTNAWVRRWTGMITYAAMDAYAASLLESVMASTLATDGVEPALGQLLHPALAGDQPPAVQPCGVDRLPLAGELLDAA